MPIAGLILYILIIVLVLIIQVMLLVKFNDIKLKLIITLASVLANISSYCMIKFMFLK